jgi:hypothetical protein
MEGSDLPPAPPIVESAGQETGGSAAPAFDIDSSITPPSTPKKKFGGKKVIATILGVLVLIGGLGAGVILVQQQQDIRQRAAMTPGDGGGGGGTATLTPTPTRVPTPPTGTSTPTGTPTAPPTNACVKAGGQCYTASSCGKVGRSAVNGGSGCGNVEQVCCSSGAGATPTTIPTNSCVKAGGECYKAPNCTFAVGKPAVNGGSGCEDPNYICCQPGGTIGPTTTPSTAPSSQCSRVSLVSSNTNATSITITQAMVNECSSKCPGAVLWVSRYRCDGIGLSQGCQDNGEVLTFNAKVGQTYSANDPSCGTIQVDVGCKSTGNTWGGVAFVSKAASKACTPTTTPPPGATAQCLNIRAYDTEWNEIPASILPSLKAGDKVRFAVAGTASSGSFDKAKFKINGVERAEVATKKPSSQEFYDEYTIPEGVTTFTINAQIHHTTLGWSN